MRLLVLPVACVAAFTAPPQIVGGTCARTLVAPRMGLFDNLKGAFDNDPRLESQKPAAGKSSKVPEYVKKKEQERMAREQKMQQNQARSSADDGGNGDRTLGDLFQGWKW